MEYGIKEVANLTGLTTRTLRYYDEIDLLKPSRVGDNGYRFYESKELEILQQIMFYRKRGFELKQIKDIIDNPEFDVAKALKEHLAEYFEDFGDYIYECQFSSCSHTKEKGCAVIKAVKEGRIEKTRHESYVALFEELKDLKMWQNKHKK